ncbi:LOW QUALITY PROTEIN: NFX1-type zinc finger-containing protein 1-like [Gigantopelta aegis]|uniref:LOW QUALITY PROTEIN: NFX1-type zinc finger-containing protein 1-like n=1 Tax=Gigantopelta aegis TaxID=1735272 RepID=UPI001B88D48E|nr:LOW QUALITY PROTEIN: NFX1-type zinc finger-containing protein 1-like [Gigantopelta aegis]
MHGNERNNQPVNHPIERDDFDDVSRIEDKGCRAFSWRTRGTDRRPPRGRGEGRGGRDRMHEEHQQKKDRDSASSGDAIQHRRDVISQVRKLTYRQLVELKCKDASDIVMFLASEETNFASLLQAIPSDNMMRVILHLLTKACGTNSIRTLLFEVLRTVEQSKFLQGTVTNALTSLAEDTSSDRARDDKEFLKNLLVLLQQLSVSFPHSVVMILGLKDVLKFTIMELEDTYDVDASIVDDEIRELMTALDGLKGSMFTKIHSEREKRNNFVQVGEEPPDDFRDLSVCPTDEDIKPGTRTPFLREIKAKGGYKDLNQYLDIHFRLLREDFICPLREGIAVYLQPQPVYPRQKNKDITVYNGVRIVKTVCSRRALLHRLEFDVGELKHVRWENTKRLIYGSLVCLSNDNFNTFLFATVSERDSKLLRKGIIDVSFEHDLPQGLDDVSFVMVETTAFFEAYRHVLKCLQQIHKGQLPFQRYIITCNNNLLPPKYLRSQRSVQFDLRPLVDDAFVIRDDDTHGQQVANYNFSPKSRRAKNVGILDLKNWPTPELLHLNQSQYMALQAALTHEFVVAQGPPGTGKTYVGLKIVKALLHNISVWNSGENSPMLIVCYTNHALDQFLEGIANFFTGNMIRVGSRSQSEIISKYTLKEKRQEFRKSSFRSREMGRVRYEYTKRLKQLQFEMECQSAPFESCEREILNENTLKPYMGNFVNQLVNHELEQKPVIVKQQSMMLKWLGLDQMVGEAQASVAKEVDIDDQSDSEQHEDHDFIAVQEQAEILQQQRQLDDYGDDDDDNEDLHLTKTIVRQVPQERKHYIVVDVSNTDSVPHDNAQLTEQFQLQKKARKRMKRKLVKQLRESERMSAQEMRSIENIWTLPMPQRYKLYKAWIYAFRQHIQQELAAKETIYGRFVNLLKEIDIQEDKKVLERATVIGMTTTGAAKYQRVLSEIGPKIVIVEEAAEVLEGHVIATLGQGCQHLILIGDHKQLRPNPNVYRLAKDYSLDLSLFERMVNNGVPCNTLEIQHRMRPEISSLMTHIYPNLKDGNSVKLYPSVMGVSKNLFFITHSHLEKHDREMVSHSNEFEAKYIVELCSYMLKQGYDKSQITILTTYSGQLLTLKKLMPKHIFEGVRVTVVDNFQGEENDIILLSLVRSNDENIVGFLKIENRICVALSRAKHGLFVIGNFDLLSQNSKLWKDLVKDRRINDEIGPALKLVCQNHPNDAGILATKPEDFAKSPEGGCMKACQFRLECGHNCTLHCHPYDPQHETYQCKKQCTKLICALDHRCTRLCFEKCGKCTVKVEKIIPGCQHKQMVECYLDPEEMSCTQSCTGVLSCGHTCGALCGSPHQCTAQLKIHKGHIPEDLLERQCVVECEATLTCGHECWGNCNIRHQGKLHKSCSQKCNKILVCGHECTNTCSNCPPCEKACENQCTHRVWKCPKKCGDVCEPCMASCAWICEHHQCTKKCSEPCNRDPCNYPCEKRLPCGHQCIGMCGEPCPKACRVCNQELVSKALVLSGKETKKDARFVKLENCGHVFEVSYLDQWMKTESHTDDKVLSLKACPSCDTVIRQNMRYGKLIKEQLQNIEDVKRHILKSQNSIKQLQFEVRFSIQVHKEHREKKEMYLRGYNESVAGLTTILNQLEFLMKIENLINQFSLVTAMKTSLKSKVAVYLADLEQFRQWILNKKTYALSEQEIADAQRELERYTAALGMIKIEETLLDRNIKLDSLLEVRFQRVLQYVDDTHPFTPQRYQFVKAVVEKIKKLTPNSMKEIIDAERVSILKVADLSVGHWFKCKNGHIYSIGERVEGVKARCPECCKTQDRRSHRLMVDSALAPELDGARHATSSKPE